MFLLLSLPLSENKKNVMILRYHNGNEQKVMQRLIPSGIIWKVHSLYIEICNCNSC